MAGIDVMADIAIPPEITLIVDYVSQILDRKLAAAVSSINSHNRNSTTAPAGRRQRVTPSPGPWTMKVALKSSEDYRALKQRNSQTSVALDVRKALQGHNESPWGQLITMEFYAAGAESNQILLKFRTEHDRLAAMQQQEMARFVKALGLSAGATAFPIMFLIAFDHPKVSRAFPHNVLLDCTREMNPNIRIRTVFRREGMLIMVLEDENSRRLAHEQGVVVSLEGNLSGVHVPDIRDVDPRTWLQFCSNCWCPDPNHDYDTCRKTKEPTCGKCSEPHNRFSKEIGPGSPKPGVRCDNAPRCINCRSQYNDDPSKCGHEAWSAKCTFKNTVRMRERAASYRPPKLNERNRNDHQKFKVAHVGREANRSPRPKSPSKTQDRHVQPTDSLQESHKEATATDPASTTDQEHDEVVPPRRPRGRPRKNKASTAMGATDPPLTPASAPATAAQTPTRSTEEPASSHITEMAGASHRNDEAVVGTRDDPPIAGNGKAPAVRRRGRPPKSAVNTSSSPSSSPSSNNNARTTQAPATPPAPIRRSTRVQDQNRSQVSATLNPTQSPAPDQSTLGTENGASTAGGPAAPAQRTPTSTRQPVQRGGATQTKMTSYLHPGGRPRS